MDTPADSALAFSSEKISSTKKQKGIHRSF